MSPLDGTAHQGVTAENRSGQQYVKHADGNQNVNSGGTQNNTHNNYFPMPFSYGMPGRYHLVGQQLDKIHLNNEDKSKTSRENILTRLSSQRGQTPLDLSGHHRRLRGQVDPETTLGIGRILESIEFKNWRDSHDRDHENVRILGISGRIGSGKSTLVSFIVDSIETHIKAQGRRHDACAYFYFQEEEKHRIPSTRVWATLLAQLLQRDVEFPLETRHYDKLQGPRPLESHDYIELFQSQADVFKTVYLVLDGLDSCQDAAGEETQECLKSALKRLPSNIRILYTCRNKEIGMDFGPHQKLRTSPTKKDVSRYVDDRIKNNKAFECVLASSNDNCRQRVIDKVTTKTLASRMFLLAKLHMDYIEKKKTVNDVDTALRELPHEVFGKSGAFENAARRMAELEEADDICLARHITTWVVYAKAEMNAEQILDSFAVSKSEGKPYQDHRPPKEHLMPLCNGLVIRDSEKDTLSLVHKSARKYLEQKGMIESNADVSIGKTCLFYLLVDQCEQQAALPLLRYAAEHWWAHLERVGAHLSPEIHQLIFSFLMNSPKLNRAFTVLGGANHDDLDGLTGLHVAVHFNLPCSLVEPLLKYGVDINAQCGDGQTALHWAVRYGRRELLDLLIAKSANPNICDELGEVPLHKTLVGPTAENTPLHKATFRSPNDDADMILALIRGGAKLEILGKKGFSPLSAAIRYGPTSVARTMIRSQKDINAEISPGWTSLREVFYHAQSEIPRQQESLAAKSAQENHARILTIELLESGVDLNRPTTDGWTPLTYAAKTGDGDNMDRMLSRDHDPANVHLRDGEGISPLHWAIAYGKVREVALLARYGANVNETYQQRPREESWPLLEAVRLNDSISSTIAEILIRHGAPVDREVASGSTLLIESVRRGNCELTWILLNAGAPPYACDKNGHSALFHAVRSSSKDLVWLLLTRMTACAEPVVSKKKKEQGLTRALEQALKQADLSIAWLLCEHGASVNGTTREDGLSPLHRAAKKGDLEVARFLLDRGALILSMDQNGFIPLHHAIRKGNEDMAALLASRHSATHQQGSPINHPNSHGETPLIMAIMNQQPAITEVLLRHGASCTVTCSPSGLAPLHYAVLQGFHEGVSLVLQHHNAGGDDPNNIQDEHGLTPLHHAVHQGCDQAMIALFFAKADIKVNTDVRDKFDRTPLMLAAQLGRSELVRSLLGYGANALAQTGGPDGVQAVDYAIGEECAEARKTLEDWMDSMEDQEWSDIYSA